MNNVKAALPYRRTAQYRHHNRVNVIMALLAFTLSFIAVSVRAEPWRFGVMGDSQWASPDDGKNPNGVAAGIITQINRQFIRAGVKLVVQVGDLVETCSDAALDARARAAQELCSAGIGFYPLRGNHEPTQAAAQGFQVLFPQTQGNGACVNGATNFRSPGPNLKGLSYSFDYNNARFVLLDQYTRGDGSGKSIGENIVDQLAWVDATLDGKPSQGHAFVFSHKNLIGQSHADVLFGANPGQNPAAQEQFIRILNSRGVRYYISGHDHIHQRSIITSPGGAWHVQQIITASSSSKFYIPQGSPELPGSINNDLKYDDPPREYSISQELNTIGYYICTVDGPQVSVDYYSAPAGAARVRNGYFIANTPVLAFTKKESFGYSLNGKEFVISRGGYYTSVRDSSPFARTSARIINGCNRSTGVGNGHASGRLVNTAWTSGPRGAASDTLTLWGMERSLGSAETDVYTLSMTYNNKIVKREILTGGRFGLVAVDAHGHRVNAVEENFGGEQKRFIFGPWRQDYTLGTHGVDPRTHTAWAAINHGGTFAADVWEKGKK